MNDCCPPEIKKFISKTCTEGDVHEMIVSFCAVQKDANHVESSQRFSCIGVFIQVITSLFNFVIFYISQKAKTVKKVSPSQNLGLHPIFGPRPKAEVKEVKEEKDRPWVEFMVRFEGFTGKGNLKNLSKAVGLNRCFVF